MELDCVVRGGTVVFPERGVAPADIAIRDGRIAGILCPGEATGSVRETIDASDRHVFPGLMDPHLHFGFAEPIEEFRTETASAAIGGLTSTIAYFLSSDPYSEMFQQAVEDCAARAHIDFAFHFSIATETHLAEFERYVRDYGVTSFKHFMNFKGEEGRYMGLAGTDDGFMYDLMQTAAGHEHVVIVAHPENIEVVNRIKAQFIEAGHDGLKAYCRSKPTFSESENIVRAMHFAEHLGARVYFPHVSCAEGFEEVRRFRRRYDRILVETCPHYLTHDWDSDMGSLGKANPPLRSPEDVEATWAALADGTIDTIGSDHVPRRRANKEKNIWQASQGFPGAATILPVLLSEGYHKRGLGLQRIAQVCGSRPAEIFAIDKRKGFIAPGYDADLTIVDLDLEREVRWQDLLSHADYSPYDGWTLKGWPVMSMVRGTVVTRDGKLVGPAGHGQYLRRPLD